MEESRPASVSVQHQDYLYSATNSAADSSSKESLVVKGNRLSTFLSCCDVHKMNRIRELGMKIATSNSARTILPKS